MTAETYWQLLTSWPHWAIELTVEAATSLVLYPFARFVWTRHHKEKH